MPRKRKYIPLTERLAAALACLLPQAQRDDLRARKVPAKAVIGLFDQDHIVLHAFDGSDRWHNLDPKIRAPHRIKSAGDTAIVAKVKRIRGETCNGPKRAIPSRPFPRSTRKIQSRPFPERRP
jgi:hypothetical protein